MYQYIKKGISASLAFHLNQNDFRLLVMPISKDQLKTQLDALGDFHRFFTAPELRYLPDILSDGEKVRAITSGLYEGKTWLVVITNRRMIFLDKGFLYGLRQLDMPLSQISTVSHKSGMFFGELQVSTSAGTKSIGSIPKKDILKLTSIIAGILHGDDHHEHEDDGVVSIKEPFSVDLASQLERLSDLHTKGVLDDEEFRQSKSILLGRPGKVPTLDL